MEDVRAELFENQDEAYREFNCKCNPEIKNSIGVRIPIIRKIAKRLCKEDFWKYLDSDKKEYYEETMLEGIIIASAPMSEMERFDYLANFVPKITDWGINDSVCASFKIKPNELEAYWSFIMRYLNSANEFELRFMLVMILDHFVLAEYLSRIFKILNHLPSNAHYVEMAAAWLTAELIIKFKDETFEFLKTTTLSDFAYNKALQKARESHRVSEPDKVLLAQMKRTKIKKKVALAKQSELV